MTVRWLPDGPAAAAARPGLAGVDHRSRQSLLRHLTGDDDAAGRLLSEYDVQAACWRAWTREQVDYVVPLIDALARAPLPVDARVVVEVCCGTGESTAALQQLGLPLLAVDGSLLMLRDHPNGKGVTRAAGDVRRLPLQSRAVDVVVGLNAVPELSEAARVLRAGGSLLWVSSYGDETPLYVPPDVLARGWDGPATAARAGHGDWLCLTRP